jgi:hypothetical protein
MIRENKSLLWFAVVIALTLISPPKLYAKDKTCTNILKFEKNRSFGKELALEKFLKKIKTVKSIGTLNVIIDQSLKCAEKRKKSLSKRKAFGSFLGAVAGATMSSGDEIDGATAGASVGYALFDDTSDKKIKSYKRVIDYLKQQVNAIESEQEKQQLDILREKQIAQATKESNERKEKEKIIEQERKLKLNATLKNKRLKFNKVKNNLVNLNTFIKSKNCTYKDDWDREKYLRDTVCDEAVKTHNNLFEKEKKKVIATAINNNRTAIKKFKLKSEILKAGFFGMTFEEGLAILISSSKNKVFIENSIFYGDFILVIKQKGTLAMKWGFENDYGDLKYTSTNIHEDGIKNLKSNTTSNGFLGRLMLEGEIESAIKTIMGIK